MTARKITPALLPAALMISAMIALKGTETNLADLASTQQNTLILGRIGLALPYIAASIIGIVSIFACQGSASIRKTGQSVALAAFILVAFALLMEAKRISPFLGHLNGQSILPYLDIYSLAGAVTALGAGLFGIKVALRGNAVFAASAPKRIKGSRAIHGDSQWMTMAKAAQMFPATGGIVIGERYRVDQDAVTDIAFEPSNKDTWGQGGKAPLLCFDADFGSTHGLVFAGSGGYKTTSVVIPTALTFEGSLIVLDPSTEIAPMVRDHRETHGQTVQIIDPKHPENGFNVLDWIGQNGNAPEEDIASVSAWLMSEKPRITSGADDFFRTSAEQLVTGVIADVMLSDPHDTSRERSLRVVRTRLAEPEETLKAKLADLYGSSDSRFVKEVIAPFINMTPQTFSGVYATAAKETHWLSYENYAALVSGSRFRTNDIADGKTTVFINIDLATLENHPGLARVIIGAFIKAIQSKQGKMSERALFLIDEAARLGYMRLIETIRDTGRKYGITLLMIFQSIGQMREAFGGRDATSKWFESVSWVSFAAINDPETARYISDRCGSTTVEASQTSRTAQARGTSRTSSKQLAQRPLILPHEIMQMRTDEQIILTTGNQPLRCGRALFFRRNDMKVSVGEN